ncbi:MAG: acyl transferase [Gammaproteobacteria bacterium]|nr:acyl transferase [Gammaproteobacteria bacterium]
MTYRSRLLSFFPLFHLLWIAGFFLALCYHFSCFNLLGFIFAVYLLPILCMRLHHYFSAPIEGTFTLTERRYCAWWGTHQFQSVFNAIPDFDAILRLIPGAYSAWLRLWGSTIGKRIYWTPLVEITDRSLMVVGDDVIFGHKVSCFAHVIIHKPDKLILYVKRITIGKRVFVGAGSRLGPGAIVDEGLSLKFLTDVKINQHLTEESLCKIGE